MSSKLDRDALVAADRRYLWRPYTSSEDHARVDPLVVVSAEGPWLIDAEGRRVLDGSGAWWCNNLGHGHPRLREALMRQASRLMHCSLAGTTHEPAVRLAEALVEQAPSGLERVFFSDNGSTSVEIALKMAFQYWQQNGRSARRLFVSLPNAYHGDTFGAMAAGDVSEFNGIYRPLLPEVLRPAEPARGEGLEGAVQAIEGWLDARGEEIAAVIVEPRVQGAAGMRIWPAALLRRLREATRRADTFLICDEVFTGFGRTGSMWASQEAGIEPDLLCTAKGLSGGVLPFAATLASGRIFDGFRGDRGRALMHGHTFCGNPLGAALALEVLAIYREEGVLEGIPEREALLREGFESLRGRPGVQRVRALGMVAAADLGDGGYLGQAGWRVHDAARALGAQLRPLGDTIYVVPPLNVPLPALRRLLEIVDEAVREAAQA